MAMNRKILFASIGFFVSVCSARAAELPDSLKNLLMAPFYFGVASGDPMSDRVILWTHITPSQPGAAQVNWQVATDTAFANLVSSGTVTTDSGKDYTVKTDAAGLQPNTWYYYRFQYNGISSITGRTKTVPTGAVNQLRAALLTCADYKDGFFNAYGLLVTRNDVDFVVHHGDYIYESNSDGNDVRQVYPTVNKCYTVGEFRSRYAFYHSDPQLVAAHQQYPWFCIWDDHEFRNDAWKDGADNITGQPWLDLRANALKVYHEWMPVRFPDASDSLRIYRKYSLGTLADLILLDARVYARDEELPFSNPAVNDTTRTILGAQQRQWLFDRLDSSTAQWKIVSQQVVMAPFSLLGNPFPSSEKAWNGFPHERKVILEHIAANNPNVIITTGDLHASLANDLPPDVAQYTESTGQGSAAVEFVTPSLTSGGSIVLSYSALKPFNPFLFFGDVTNRGYSILDIRHDTVYCNYYFTPYLTYSNQQTFAGCRCTASGKAHLQDCGAETVALNAYPAPAPAAPGAVSGIAPFVSEKFSVYPNPTSGIVNILWNPQEKADMVLLNLNGEAVLKALIHNGQNSINLKSAGVAAGVYVLQLNTKGAQLTHRIVLY